MASLSYINVTKSVNLDTSYLVHVCDATAGSLTLTLPDAGTFDAVGFYVVRQDNTGGNTATLAAASSQNINGSASVILAQYVALFIMAANGNWISVA